MSKFEVVHESPAKRCDLCHCTDMFDSETENCRRCTDLVICNSKITHTPKPWAVFNQKLLFVFYFLANITLNILIFFLPLLRFLLSLVGYAILLPISVLIIIGNIFYVFFIFCKEFFRKKLFTEISSLVHFFYTFHHYNQTLLEFDFFIFRNLFTSLGA